MLKAKKLRTTEPQQNYPVLIKKSSFLVEKLMSVVYLDILNQDMKLLAPIGLPVAQNFFGYRVITDIILSFKFKEKE